MFDGLQILSNTSKQDQTHTNAIKQHQTRCPNGKMFGHQIMFDGVWLPNIYRLSRPLVSTEKKDQTLKTALNHISSHLELRQNTFL